VRSSNEGALFFFAVATCGRYQSSTEPTRTELLDM